MVNILIADDHQILRQGLRSLLEREKDVVVVGEASNGDEVIAMAAALEPDVVILDISMPKTNGIEAARRILERDSHVKVIALSMHSDKRFIMKMLSVGASGYLLKNCAFEELSVALRAVLNSQFYVSPSIAGNIIEEYVQNVRTGKVAAKSLNEREVAIIRHLADGKSIKEVASATEMSPKTVALWRMRILEKLQIESTADLVKYAIREGITSLDG